MGHHAELTGNPEEELGKVRGAFQCVSHATSLFKLVVKGGKRFAKGERNQKGMSGRYRGNSSKGSSVNSTNHALVDNTQSAVETHVSLKSGALSAWYPQYLALCLETGKQDGHSISLCWKDSVHECVYYRFGQSFCWNLVCVEGMGRNENS